MRTSSCVYCHRGTADNVCPVGINLPQLRPQIKAIYESRTTRHQCWAIVRAGTSTARTAPPCVLGDCSNKPHTLVSGVYWQEEDTYHNTEATIRYIVIYCDTTGTALD